MRAVGARSPRKKTAERGARRSAILARILSAETPQ